ncbi:MAG: type IV pilus modification PilV family protein [Ilumatobacteraceae bacterium]
MNARRDIGETLIEVLLTIVIISVTITALVASLATAANAGTAQRNSVRIDVVLRSYAEATKSAVQGCVVGGTYTVTYQPPAGFTAGGVPAGSACPPITGTQPPPLQLTVTGPSGSHATMQLRVRTP